jgi:hypothetical protein
VTAAASLAWRADRASAFLALIRDHLHCAGLENRNDCRHRNAASVTDRRRKLNRTVRDWIEKHKSTHTHAIGMRATQAVRSMFPRGDRPLQRLLQAIGGVAGHSPQNGDRSMAYCCARR